MRSPPKLSARYIAAKQRQRLRGKLDKVIRDNYSVVLTQMTEDNDRFISELLKRLPHLRTLFSSERDEQRPTDALQHSTATY